ncbi:MAG: hypothetical protein GC200_10450 [Tepidisphaera sp.]|nr:hypothetical protein [Tepidisphaera sp.]
MNSAFTLAFCLGLRHGADPDHLTAIDGLSRVRPRVTNGLYFAIGHGLVVTALTAGVGEMLAGRAAFLGPWALILVGLFNLWQIFRPAPRSSASHPAGSHTHRLPASLALVSRPVLLGMILAAGFETSSQLSVLVLAGDSSPWLVGLAFSAGMIIVDGLDGYLAASTQAMAANGAVNARAASRWLGIIVVAYSFGLAGAELAGIDLAGFTLPLGLTLVAVVIAFRVWVRRAPHVPLSIPQPADLAHTRPSTTSHLSETRHAPITV